MVAGTLSAPSGVTPLAGDPLRVFLLDGHEIVRRGVAYILDGYDDLRVVGEAATPAEARARIALTHPDVVLLDAHLPGAEQLAGDVDARVLALAWTTDTAPLPGIDGLLPRTVSGPELADGVRAVARGRRTRLGSVEPRDEVAAACAELTPRERRVLDLLATGQTNREISAELGVAEKTVKNYVTAILAKLRLRRRAQVAALLARLMPSRP